MFHSAFLSEFKVQGHTRQNNCLPCPPMKEQQKTWGAMGACSRWVFSSIYPPKWNGGSVNMDIGNRWDQSKYTIHRKYATHRSRIEWDDQRSQRKGSSKAVGLGTLGTAYKPWGCTFQEQRLQQPSSVMSLIRLKGPWESRKYSTITEKEVIWGNFLFILS